MDSYVNLWVWCEHKLRSWRAAAWVRECLKTHKSINSSDAGCLSLLSVSPHWFCRFSFHSSYLLLAVIPEIFARMLLRVDDAGWHGGIDSREDIKRNDDDSMPEKEQRKTWRREKLFEMNRNFGDGIPLLFMLLLWFSLLEGAPPYKNIYCNKISNISSFILSILFMSSYALSLVLLKANFNAILHKFPPTENTRTARDVLGERDIACQRMWTISQLKFHTFYSRERTAKKSWKFLI